MTRKERDTMFSKDSTTEQTNKTSKINLSKINTPEVWGIGSAAGLWFLGMSFLPAAILGGIVAGGIIVVKSKGDTK